MEKGHGCSRCEVSSMLYHEVCFLIFRTKEFMQIFSEFHSCVKNPQIEDDYDKEHANTELEKHTESESEKTPEGFVR